MCLIISYFLNKKTKNKNFIKIFVLFDELCLKMNSFSDENKYFVHNT